MLFIWCSLLTRAAEPAPVSTLIMLSINPRGRCCSPATETQKRKKDEFKELKMKTELNRQASASNAGSGDDERKKLHFISSFSAVAFFSRCYAYVEWKNALDLKKKREKLL